MRVGKADAVWWVYVLRCGDGSLYCGITSDLRRRVKQHREGTGARYTRGRGPLKIAHWWVLPTRPEALRAEHAFKKLSALQKKAAIRGCARGVAPKVAAGRPLSKPKRPPNAVGSGSPEAAAAKPASARLAAGPVRVLGKKPR
jgi:putative endonuclease